MKVLILTILLIVIANKAVAQMDPVTAAQVMASAEQAFPNLAAELEAAALLRRATEDPTVRGNLRGRLAEHDWIARNREDGWRGVRSKAAPQNDAWRRVNGTLEGAQIKVHASVGDYIRSMRKDHLAERFVVPDDQFDKVWSEWEKRRLGALRGGRNEIAAEAGRQQARLQKLGRTFTEIDGAIDSTARHFGRIATALRAAGRAASFAAIALAILDSSIAVHELGTGRAEVDATIARLARTGVSAVAAWGVGKAAATTAAAMGATGVAVPAAVAIVVGAAMYFVVDWAIGEISERVHVAHLTADDVARIWPEGLRGVPLNRLYGHQ